jgi:hypothetical protein
MMCAVRTIITIILCVFVTFMHVIMLHMKVMHCGWCSFHELVENFRSLCCPECMGPLPFVDLAVRYVMQLKYKGAMKVRSDAWCN